jgi:hypothetical protein
MPITAGDKSQNGSPITTASIPMTHLLAIGPRHAQSFIRPDGGGIAPATFIVVSAMVSVKFAVESLTCRSGEII